MSDDEIWALTRGGHDPVKVYAAYAAAVAHVGSPTVILAKTVKGYGMGEAGEGQNITHQQKKMGEVDLRRFRDRFHIPIADDQLADLPLLQLNEDQRNYLKARRAALGGYLPSRRTKSESLEVPPLSAFEAQLKSTEGRQISTTMAFVRVLNTLIRDKRIGNQIVPIVPDESRTFGMEGMFRQFGILSQVGQQYRPEDANQLMYYEDSIVNRLTSGLKGLARQREVAVVHATGRFLSSHELQVDASDDGRTTLRFDQAIIAVGSEPARLPFLPVHDPRVMDSTAALDLADVPGRLLVIGGGIIGLEMATVYDALGSHVTVVELMPAHRRADCDDRHVALLLWWARRQGWW